MDTRIDEISDGIFRLSTLVPDIGPTGFTFNQFLVRGDDESLLFHTGPRRMFPLVAEAIGKIMPIERLRYVAFSHYEVDECGSLNDLLAVAPAAVPVRSQVAAMVSVNDVAARPARAPNTSSSGSDGMILNCTPVSTHRCTSRSIWALVADGMAMTMSLAL